MGSTGDLTPSGPREMTVLVTGFSPFKEGFSVNPSWEIASSLPAYLPPGSAKTAAPPSRALPPVRILTHPEPVRVSYTAVRDLVPKLWALQTVPHAAAADPAAADPAAAHPGTPDDPTAVPAIDAAIHIGMAGQRPHYMLERLGHRDGYSLPDVDGQLLGDEERRAREGPDWVWHGCPAELETGLDADDVARRWRALAPPGADLRVSDNAGRYLCDFIFYSSLAHCWKRRQHRRVVFLHVPSSGDDEAVQRGRDLTLHLIRAICESECARPRSLKAEDL